MAFQSTPGSTGGTPRTPVAPSAPSAPCVSYVQYVQRCVVLVDWWLERVEAEEGKIRVAGIAQTPQTRKGASSSKGSKKVAGRVFRSAAIATRHDFLMIETEDGYIVHIGRLLNIPRTRENGFPKKVCKCFEFGFPIEWLKLVNPNMEEQNEQAQSESTADAPEYSVEYYMAKLLSDSCTNTMRYAFTENDSYSSVGYTRNTEFGFPIDWLKRVNPNMEEQNEQAQSESTADAPKHSVEYYMAKLCDSCTNTMRYAFTENDSYSSVGYTRNTDGPAIQSLSNITDGNASNMAASLGLYGGRTKMPEKPLTPPGETCRSGQESDQHESMQRDASEQRIDNRSVSSVSVYQSTGSICPNSKVDDTILAPSIIVSLKESYGSRVGCGQAEEDANIHHENMQRCSSEQEMVTLPIDSAIVNESLNSTSFDLGEPGTPKCGKASVNLGTRDALELPTERMTQQFGLFRVSEDSPVRRLRSGKVFGTPSGVPMKRGRKQKKIQHEASSKNMVPNEGGTSIADLTSHENDSSAAGIVNEDKQDSHDTHRKRRGRPAKVKKRKRARNYLFWNWL